MRSTRMVFAVSASVMLAVAAPLWSDDAKKLTPDEMRAEYVDDIGNAHEMAAFAAKYKSPEAYITAASLLLKIEAQSKGNMGDLPKEITVIGANKKETTETLKGNNKLSDQATTWFDDARGLATDAKISKEVEILIKAAQMRDYTDHDPTAAKERGKAGGPANLTRSIKPNETDVYHWKFKGGEWAAIGMTTGSRLHISIIGPNGGELFALGGARANYRWMPKNDATYIIRIHNGTNTLTTYNLASN